MGSQNIYQSFVCLSAAYPLLGCLSTCVCTSLSCLSLSHHNNLKGPVGKYSEELLYCVLISIVGKFSGSVGVSYCIDMLSCVVW